MEIKVRLFATFRENREKEMWMNLHEGSTPMDILEKLNITKEEVAILLINGRDGDFVVQLKERDVMSIFPPVGGG